MSGKIVFDVKRGWYRAPDYEQGSTIQLSGRADAGVLRAELNEAVQAMIKAAAPIIAVDFDGTLCVNKWPEIGPAKEHVLAILRGEQHRGARLILWTNRTGALLAEAVEWCSGHGLTFDAVNENLPEIIERYGSDSRKITADVYLDDKALSVNALDVWSREHNPALNEPQAYNPAHRGAVTAEQFEAIWNDNSDDGEGGGGQV